MVRTSLCDPNDGYSWLCHYYIRSGVTLPLSVFAQQEETSLGETEDLGSGIVSDVLDRSSDDEEDGNDNEENDGGAAADDTNEQITVPTTDQDRSKPCIRS